MSAAPEEFVVRRERCDTCAFTPGTPANRRGLTVLKAKLCVLTSDPFYCHDNLMATGGSELEPAPGTPYMLCRGFVDAMEARLARDIREPDWKRRFYATLNDAIAEIEMNPLLNTQEKRMEFVNNAIAGYFAAEDAATPDARLNCGGV